MSATQYLLKKLQEVAVSDGTVSEGGDGLPQFSCNTLKGCYSSLDDITAVGWSAKSDEGAAGNLHLIKLSLFDGALLKYSILPVKYSLMGGLPAELQGLPGSIDVMPVFSPGGSFMAVPICLQAENDADSDDDDDPQGGDILILTDIQAAVIMPFPCLPREKHTVWSSDFPQIAWSPDESQLYFMGELAWLQQQRLLQLANADAFNKARQALAKSPSTFDSTGNWLGFPCNIHCEDEEDEKKAFASGSMVCNSSNGHSLQLPGWWFVQFLTSESCALLRSTTHFQAVIFNPEQKAFMRSFLLHTYAPVMLFDDRIISGRPASAYIEKVSYEDIEISEGQSVTVTKTETWCENKHAFWSRSNESSWEMDGIPAAPVVSRDEAMVAFAGPVKEKGDESDNIYFSIYGFQQRKVHLVKLW